MSENLSDGANNILEIYNLTGNLSVISKNTNYDTNDVKGFLSCFPEIFNKKLISAVLAEFEKGDDLETILQNKMGALSYLKFNLLAALCPYDNVKE